MSAGVLCWAPPAEADPGCKDALLIFARGSDAAINPMSTEAYTFFTKVNDALGRSGDFSNVVQVGDEDGDGGKRDASSPNGLGWAGVDSGEYPAVGIGDWGFQSLGMNGYYDSVATGWKELANYLNHRYANGGCSGEVAAIGGYSQGAEVVDYAINALGNEALNHVAFVAKYGDTRYVGCIQGRRAIWARVDQGCVTGILGGYADYPATLSTRIGNWCAPGDGICLGRTDLIPLPGYYSSHSGKYNMYVPNSNEFFTFDGWISQSAPEIAAAARNRLAILSPPQGGGVGTASYLGSDTLSVNQPLYRGQYIMTPEGNFVLYFQPDGNLVVFGHRFQPIWASNTAGGSGAFVVLQPDGNWVMYSGSGQPVWYNGANGTTGNRVVIQPDGNLVEYNPYGQAVWYSATSRSVPGVSYYGSDHLNAGQSLNRGQYLRSGSGTGTRFLLLQSDGNLVLYGPGHHLLWHSGTSGTGACHLDMQPDGNLVLYTPTGQAVWSSGTSGMSATHADVQPDGNVVVYNSAGQAVWWSGTAGQI